MFCESVYYNTQQTYLIPVVNEAWEAESRRQIEKLTGKTVATVQDTAPNMAPTH